MPDVILLTEANLRASVPLDLAAIDCVADAFRALDGGGVVMPPVLSMHMAAVNGEVDVKTAFVPGLAGFAIKASPGFFDNPSKGLPSTSGMMTVFSTETGMVKAVLLDNGYLTDLRTAGAGAVAARALSRADASTAAIFGAGMQARLQLRALCLVRPIKRAVIWARDLQKATATAQDLTRDLGIDVTATANARDAVRGADVIVTTTPSRIPLIEAAWLAPGQHVTAMGSDQDGKQEVEAACIARADLYVPDRQSQTAIIGELRSALKAGLIEPDRTFAELGAVLSGAAPGRPNADAITIADLTGTGVQDTAIATHAMTRAALAGVGTVVSSS